MLLESEAKLLKFSRKELGETIREHLPIILLDKFRKNFWLKENGFERHWGSMHYDEIADLYRSNKKNFKDCIEGI